MIVKQTNKNQVLSQKLSKKFDKLVVITKKKSFKPRLEIKKNLLKLSKLNIRLKCKPSIK